MTLLERLQAHKGGLLRIKTQLYWYGGRGGWDGNPGRICLVLDATTRAAAIPDTTAAALLLIDGAPYWVWVAEDIELLDGDHQ